MFLILTVNVFCVFLMVLPGIFSRKLNWIDQNTTKQMSQLLITFIYPCLIFQAIYKNYSIQDLCDQWLLPASSFGLMLLGYIVGLVFSVVMSFQSDNEKRAFLFQSAMNNYSYLPLPIVMVLFKEEGVAALIFSTLGAEFAVWTIGIFIMSGHKFSLKSLTHLLSPPLIALYLAVICRFITDQIGISFELMDPKKNSFFPYFFSTLETFGKATIPLAMVIAGSRIAALSDFSLKNWNLWILSALRLCIVPIIFLIILNLLPITPLIKNVMSIVAVMPVAIASFMISEIYGGDKNFITSTVIVTHIVSLITVPLILMFFL